MPAPSNHAWVAAALAFAERARAGAPYPAEIAGFTNCVGLAWPLVLESDEVRNSLAIEPGSRPGEVCVRVGSEPVRATLVRVTAEAIEALFDGVHAHFDHGWDGERLSLRTPEGTLCFHEVTHASPETREQQAKGDASAPMDGTVVDVPVQVGQRVVSGQTLVIVEAMKLEQRIAADRDGTVTAVHVQPGDQVKARQVLVEVASP